MPTAVTFYQLPEEEEALLRYVDRTGDILACRAWSDTDPDLFEPRPFLEYIEEHDPDDVLIGPREFMDQSPLKSTEHEGSILYSRHYWRDPLVLYDRPRLRAPRRLGGSNMCTDWTYPPPDWPARKPEAFIKWAQKVFRWVRRFTPNRGGILLGLHKQHKGYRVTEKVAAEIAKGLELVP